MEMYTWPDSSVKVLLSHDELKTHGIDLYRNSIHDDKAEVFFTSVLQTISHHYNMTSDVQIDAEINESEDYNIYMIVRFYDEEGNKAQMVPSKAPKNSLIYRFSRREDMFDAADRCLHYKEIEGGMLIRWEPCYYLIFQPGEVQDTELLSVLMEEYGERAHVNMQVLKKKGSVLQRSDALQSLASRLI